MKIYGFYPGQSFEIYFKIKDTTVTPNVGIPLASFSDVLVYVYKLGGNVVKKWSMNEMEGHETEGFIPVPDDDGGFMLLFTQELTSGLISGEYIAEIKAKFSDSEMAPVGSEKIFTIFTVSKTKNVIL